LVIDGTGPAKKARTCARFTFEGAASLALSKCFGHQRNLEILDLENQFD